MGNQCGGAIRLPVRAMKERMSVSIAALALGRIAADLRVEQGLGHDLQGQPHHVVLDVADLSVVPRFEHPLGVFDHEPGIGGDSLAVERRLGKLALASPEFPFAGQEPLTQRPPRLPQPIMLDELAILVDQNLFDQVGMVGEDDISGSEPGRDQVAVLAGPAGHGSQLVAAELLQVAEEPLPLRSGNGLILGRAR